MTSENVWPYTIQNIVISQDSVNITYSVFEKLYTGRVTVHFDEFSQKTLQAAIEKDIETLRPKLEKIFAIITEWKGKTVDYQLT